MPGPFTPGGWWRWAGLGGIGADGVTRTELDGTACGSAARRERDREREHGGDEQRDKRERDRPHGELSGCRERVLGAASEG